MPIHIVERFTRVAPDQMNDEITLTDPPTWTKSGTAVIHLKRMHDKLDEYAYRAGTACSP